MDNDDILMHYGILGQKWGLRRWQNEDGSLTPEGREHYMKKDTKWAKKNYDKIYKKVYKKSRDEMDDYVRSDLNQRSDISKYNANGKLSWQYVNEYNQHLAQVMTRNASDISTPNLGLAVKYIAKRGAVGTHMIISDQSYNINNLKNGVYDSGRIAYKKDIVNRS